VSKRDLRKKAENTGAHSQSTRKISHFRLEWTDQASQDHEELLTNPTFKKRLKAVNKALGFMEINLRHPSLNTHEFQSLKGPKGEKVNEAVTEWLVAHC